MADRIYGVTTRDSGVSTVVSAELVREAVTALA
jgi:chromosome segregation ATPase